MLFGCLCLAYLPTLAQTTERSLVLAAASDHEIGAVTRSEARKAFLGVPVTKGEIRLRPLLNATDPLATSIFLQQVIFMAEREYRRQLVSRVFRLGDQHPTEHEDIDALVQDLRTTPGSLTFLWSDQLERYEGLESLGVIWTSSDD